MQGLDRTSKSCICYTITEIIQYIAIIGKSINGEYDEVAKRDDPPPSVGGDRSKVKKKFINLKQWGYIVSEGVGGDCGEIRRSTWHIPDTTDIETANVADDGVKKQSRFPSSEGGVNERADEVEYNHFTIYPFFKEVISATVFHHFTM